MPTAQQTKEDVMSKVNSIMAAINLYPEINVTNTQLSFSSLPNPIDLLIDFFKTTMGYDYLIEKVSEYVAYAIPVLEVAVKGILLSNIRIMLSCSVNPLITEGMIRKGVVFDLNKIDLLNIFNYSPLDNSITNPGRYYYFGCSPEDGIEIIDDLKMARDLNAVLWYTKNSLGERVVWRRDMDVGKPYNVVELPNGGWSKQVKSNGIVTLEFNGRSSGLKDAEGNPDYNIQEPINNCLHVFIGYCAPERENNHDTAITQCTKIINKFDKLNKELDTLEEKIQESRRQTKTDVIEQGADEETLNKIDVDCEKDLALINKIRYAIDGINIDDNPHTGGHDMCDILGTSYFEFNSIHENLTIESDLCTTNVIKKRAEKVDYMNQDAGITPNYPSVYSNYYYKHPLFEWNTDFVMATKIFDEKVVTAQLIDALTQCLSFNGGISITPQMKFVQAQLRDLVTKIIETDEGTVSDCFFSFTNDSYNDLLNEVELNRVNLQPVNNQTVNNIPSAGDIMESLNTLSPDASKEEMQSAISSSLFAATSSTNPVDGIDGGFVPGVSVNFSILDQLLNQLVYVIILTIIQPKIYVLLITNLKLIGDEPAFDLAKFIQQFKDLISQLIKEIRDNILEFFKTKLLEVLQMLLKTLAIKLTLEQYQYYIALLTHCIDCLKLHRGQFDWLQDDVDYADITELNQEENQEC